MVTSKTIGIKELKVNPGKIIRAARDSNTSLIITIRGEEVATIVPRSTATGTVEEPSRGDPNRKYTSEELAAYWKRHEEISREISKNWPEGVSALDAINDVRREL